MSREWESSWPDQVSAAIAAELAAVRPERVPARLIPTLRRGRQLTGDGVEPPEITEEIVAAGVASLITRRLATEEPQSLMSLHPGLVEFALTPYLGSRAAAEVASKGVRS